MNDEQLRQFVKELKALQNKYGIFITSSYEEEIDYDWDEQPYISGVQSFVEFIDSEGQKIQISEEHFRDEDDEPGLFTERNT